jgi:hypothetical protein
MKEAPPPLDWKVGPALGPDASSPSASTHLAVRLWTANRTALTWSTESPLVYMVHDLVLASGGVANPKLGLVATFDRALDALRAAKRIQWAVLEFAQVRPEQCAGAAIVIYQSSELSSGSLEQITQAASSVLDQSKPPQIFVAANAGRQLQAIPGLQLQKNAWPALAAGEFERGVQELIWTTPQSYKRVQDLLKHASRKILPESQKALASEPTVDLTVPSEPTPIPVQQTRPIRIDSTAKFEPGNLEGPPEPRIEIETEEVEERSHASYWWWGFAVVGMAALAASIFLVVQPTKKSELPENTPAVQQVSPVRPEDNQPAKTEAVPTPQGNAETVQPAPSSIEQPQVPAAQSLPAPATSERPSRPAANKKVIEYQGFSEKDIPFLLRIADSKAGEGDYSEAAREYEIVLRLDPNNAAAKQGLRKVKAAGTRSE